MIDEFRTQRRQPLVNLFKSTHAIQNRTFTVVNVDLAIYRLLDFTTIGWSDAGRGGRSWQAASQLLKNKVTKKRIAPDPSLPQHKTNELILQPLSIPPQLAVQSVCRGSRFACIDIRF